MFKDDGKFTVDDLPYLQEQKEKAETILSGCEKKERYLWRGAIRNSKAWIKKLGGLECECCHIIDKTVKKRLCGYQQDVNGKDVWETVCDMCEENHLGDI